MSNGTALHLEEIATACETATTVWLDPMIHTACDRPDPHMAPRYTSSIDAAISLFPSGWTWGHLQRCDRLREFAALLRPNLDGKGAGDFWTGYVIGRAGTPARAICAAALRARAKQLSDTHRPAEDAPGGAG